MSMPHSRWVTKTLIWPSLLPLEDQIFVNFKRFTLTEVDLLFVLYIFLLSAFSCLFVCVCLGRDEVWLGKYEEGIAKYLTSSLFLTMYFLIPVFVPIYPQIISFKYWDILTYYNGATLINTWSL